MQRRTFIRGGLTRKGSAGLVRRAIGLAPEPRAAAPVEVAALPSTTPYWEKDADGPFLVITDCHPGETVGDVLKRLHIRSKSAAAYGERDYIMQVWRSEKKKVRSKFWKTANGKYEPRPGIPCLILEFGEWDAATKTWTTTAIPIQAAILKSEVPAGFALRIRQVPFDYGQMANAHWSISRRKFARYCVEALVEGRELCRA